MSSSVDAATPVAVVTGAGSGMGRVMACSLAGAGYTVIAVDLREGIAAELAAEPEFGGKAPKTLAADLSKTEECLAVASAILENGGRCDVLVNCAGISMGPLSPPGLTRLPCFWEVEDGPLVTMVNLHVVACLLLAKKLVPGMMERGWGRIVNITTSFDTMLTPGMSVYGATKSGLEAATASWAGELEGTGVTANVLVPGGMVATPFIPQHLHGSALDPAVMKAPIRFLASRDSDGVNGRRIVASLWKAEDAGALDPAAWPELAERARTTRGW